MNRQSSAAVVPMGFIILIMSIGLLAGCGNRDSSPGNDTPGDTGMSENPQAQPERPYNEDFNTAKNQQQTFEASLEGSNEVPEVETEASGSVTVTLQGDSIQVEGEFSGLGSEYVASHIHIGSEDENGDPIQPLEPEVGSDNTSGSWNASYQLDQNHISALKADSLYINVHSAENKAGEIRGQLTSPGMINM